MKDSRQILKNLLLEESIKLVCEAITSDEVIHIRNRLANLETQNRRGLVSFEQYTTGKNEIQWSWIETINLLTDQEIQQITERSFLKLNPEKVSARFLAASHRLNDWKSDFQNIPNSHIRRDETNQIIQWIDAPLPHDEKGIALLAGDAGTGKSVILRDVLLTLQDRKTPVLGIKADQYCVESIEKLEEALYLKGSIEEMAWTLTQEKGRVVVLVDQIDALSQSLSARRIYLENFTNLVQALAEIPEVRIVVSCRKYDLQNDHEFAFYRRQKAFEIGFLSEEEVHGILKKLSSNLPKLPDDLMGLLKTPLHLDVFCRVFRSNLAFEKITVLRDLYDELWLQKVVEIKTPGDKVVVPEKIEQLIFELARKMYDDQDLTVASKLFRARFSKELEYLKSEGILLESKEGLTFFHQTFYDFSFAKQFIKSGIAVEKYLLDNGQNLHIRACVKMMLEFLREDDRLQYLLVMRTILGGSEFYFHIKSLAISLLGYVKKPFPEEIQLARELIFPNPDFFKAFLASVKSREWLLFLLDEKQPHRLVENAPFGIEPGADTRERLLEILNGLQLRHLPECRHELLQFVFDLPEIEGKIWLVLNTLRNIGTWDNPLAFILFENYAPKMNEVFFSEFLEAAAESDLNWSFGQLKKAIQKAADDKTSDFDDLRFEYELAKLIEHLIEKHPEPTFDLLLDFQMQRLLLPQDSRRMVDPNAIFNDFPIFWPGFNENNRDNTKLFPLLVMCVRVLARAGSPRFSHFATENLTSLSATRLLILVEGFRANPSANTVRIAHFLSIFIKNRRIDASETLAWRVRRLLEETFSEFSEIEKRQLILLVSQIESDGEKEWATENNRPDWIGNVRFKWLKCLPENEIAQIPEVAEIFRELSDRFPVLEDEEPNKFKTYSVGPPLEQHEYDNMSFEDWKASFFKFDEKYEPEWTSHKGGSLEHARQFETEVKKRPDYFFPLIEELISIKSLPKTYLIHGLDGLKEAKYDPERLLFLFKKILPTLADFDIFEVRRLVGLCSVFSNDKIEDDLVVEFLAQMAMTHADPEENKSRIVINNGAEDSTYVSGFQTVRGSAVHLLPYFYYFKKHESLIFETLEHVAEQDFLMVRSQMVPRLALLTNLDKARSLRLFLRLVRDNEAAVMEHSAWSAQYFARQNFEGMRPYFENALAHPKLARDMGVILGLTYIHERSDALDLLNRFFEKSDDAKVGAIDVAAHNLSDESGKLILRSLELFERFLEESSDTVIHAYDSAFRDLKSGDFLYLQPTLKRFSRTVVARKNPRPFYEYLILCAKSEPEACLDLVANFAGYERPNIQYARYYDNEPLKVVLNAYHTLWGKRIKDHTLLKKALLLFDSMLLDDRFRRDAEVVLMSVER